MANKRREASVKNLLCLAPRSSLVLNSEVSIFQPTQMSSIWLHVRITRGAVLKKRKRKDMPSSTPTSANRISVDEPKVNCVCVYIYIEHRN